MAGKMIEPAPQPQVGERFLDFMGQAVVVESVSAPPGGVTVVEYSWNEGVDKNYLSLGKFNEHFTLDPHDEMIDLSEGAVNHPDHYTWMNGIEVIDVTSNFNFTIGNALKYLMRHEHKGQPLEDLKKAQWYIAYEIARLEKAEADEAQSQ